MPATPASLQSFVTYCKKLQGDEKSEAQSFLDRFFQAFGHEGAIEAGAEFEARVKKGSKKGNTGYADLVWKPHLLIEMKKRGEDLTKHYAQAVTYWMQLQCPNYVMLCNFDEFWIYDFRKQSEEPIEKIGLEQLPDRLGAFNFMNPEQDRPPVFNNNLVLVTEKAARRMGELLTMLIDRKQTQLIRKWLNALCCSACWRCLQKTGNCCPMICLSALCASVSIEPARANRRIATTFWGICFKR